MIKLMKKIYFVRHGESEANAAGLTAGYELDTPLTAKGRSQAKETGLRLKDKQIKLIISSPLGRAMDTAKIIAEVIGYNPEKIIPSQDLIERGVGIYSGQPDDGYLKDAYDNKLHPSVESAQAMHDRVVKALAWIKNLPEDEILVVSHGGISRVLRIIHLELPHSHMYKLDRFGNAEIYEFEL